MNLITAHPSLLDIPGITLLVYSTHRQPIDISAGLSAFYPLTKLQEFSLASLFLLSIYKFTFTFTELFSKTVKTCCDLNVLIKSIKYKLVLRKLIAHPLNNMITKIQTW